LIDRALALIAVIDPGETPSSDERDHALDVLNQIVSNWSAQALPIPQITRETITATGAASYALGTRPMKVKAAAVVSTATVSMPAELVSAEVWNAHIDKVVSAPFARVAYYEDGYPLGRLHLAPKPTTGTVELFSDKPMRESGMLEIRESFALTGAASYTVGVGGNFATERPAKLKGVSVTAASSISKPLEIVSADKWAAYAEKGEQGNFGDVLFYDAGFPTATIYVAPRPTSGLIELYTLRALAAFSALADTITLPNGYEHALRHELAITLAPEYGAPVSKTLMENAANAKTAVFGLNQATLGHPGNPPLEKPEKPEKPAAA
jgi:hypothetical protein